MGRKTFASIGKPLPKRTNIIVTRNKNYQVPKCLVVWSLENALYVAKQIDQEEIFIIGGGEIYKQALKFADKLYLTIVKGKFEADTYFPDYGEFKKVISARKISNQQHKYTFWELTK